jgi:carbamoyl-phosphate synthase large subunit
MGGQTALNCALDLHRHGVLAKYGVEMIGANEHAIEKAEDRMKFKDAMTSIGLDSAKSGIAHSMEEALAVQKRIQADIGGTGFPMVIRPSFTMGGTGGGIAYNPKSSRRSASAGWTCRPPRNC